MPVPLCLPDAFTEVNEPLLDPLPPGMHEAYRLSCQSGYGLTIIRVGRSDNPELAKLARGAVLQKLNAAQVVIEESGEILQRFSYDLTRHDWAWDKERRTRHRDLCRDQWLSLRILLQAAHFWDMPERGGSSGVDGATTTLEGSWRRRYRRVSRWCPSAERDREWLVLPCGYLWDLADANE